MGARVCHMTTVHPVFDVRIFHKECRSLVRHGYEVYLIGGCEREEIVDGVHLVPFRKSGRKGLNRVIHGWRAFRKAAAVNAAVYHFHDPELLWIGVLIKLFLRARVLYDVHEDIQKHALGKAWIHPILRRIIAFGLNALEKTSELFFDTIVLAVDSFESKFRSRKVVIYNYPLLVQRASDAKSGSDPTLIYIGAIREIRGIYQMLEALELLKKEFPAIQLRLIGPFYPIQLEENVRDSIRKQALDSHVQILGRIPHSDIFGHIQASDIGLALLHPDPNYVGGLPTKMFEYMMMGIPAVVSDFPLWRTIIQDAESGVVVNPLDVRAIAEVIGSLLRDKETRKRMGEAGRTAIHETYNWNQEERKLIACYQDLISAT